MKQLMMKDHTWSAEAIALHSRARKMMEQYFRDYIEDGVSLMEVAGLLHAAIDEARCIVVLDHRFNKKD